MPHKIKTLFFLLLIFLLAHQAIAKPTPTYSSALFQLYDDGSQMNTHIISEFLSSEICQKMCERWSKQEVANQFQTFRLTWVERMVNFVIAQLNIDPQSAKRVKYNPSNYMVNYQTFKLLSFK